MNVRFIPFNIKIDDESDFISESDRSEKAKQMVERFITDCHPNDISDVKAAALTLAQVVKSFYESTRDNQFDKPSIN